MENVAQVDFPFSPRDFSLAVASVVGNALLFGPDGPQGETRAGSQPSRTEDQVMKRFLFVALVALGLTSATRSAKADCAFEYSCSRHFSYVHTSKSRCQFPLWR